MGDHHKSIENAEWLPLSKTAIKTDSSPSLYYTNLFDSPSQVAMFTFQPT
jgi:hypothetical protein